MKKYDFVKAKKLIRENKENLESASIGMHEDWFWTAETVWEGGKYKQKLNKDSNLGGINESEWATPTLQLCYKGGREEMIEISIGANEKDGPPFTINGVMSGPTQESIKPISRKE